jgi:hypothetical protein
MDYDIETGAPICIQRRAAVSFGTAGYTTSAIQSCERVELSAPSSINNSVDVKNTDGRRRSCSDVHKVIRTHPAKTVKGVEGFKRVALNQPNKTST